MKKSIAAVLLGSALLLSNNNAEASYSNNEVKINKVDNVQYTGWGSKQFYFFNSNLNNMNYNGYQYHWTNKNHHTDIEAVPTPPKEPVPNEEAPVSPAVPEAVPTPVPVKQPVPAPTEKPVQEAVTNNSISAIENAVLNLTNVERKKAGLSALQVDSKLMNSARQKSTDMATNNYFSHTSPTYGSPFDQMKANGVTYKSAAENIAAGQVSAEEVVKAWMESPGHRQNILAADFTHIGIGFDKNGNFWTQQFISK
ncbi:CAP domain-containing protein [Sporosarcina siberiensis]|uniref:CAP domain-containing protein n=1 Tax=Sporosarcina siberiensis TaxID=1365606 RepID=A0ABW4SHY4_9BACL